MLFTNYKKGITWLRRDFDDQLKKALTENHVVDLRTLVNFEGKDRVIDNMISREELEEASYADIQKQKAIISEREKILAVRRNEKNKLEEEEAALKAAMGI